MSASTHTDIDRRALRDQVYDRILDMLLLDELEPGQRLSINTLARDLQVSPTPVREAMVHLERTGLVTREALKGYRVAEPLGREQFLELFEARLILEVAAADAASRRAKETAELLRSAHERHVASAERVVAAHTAQDRVPLHVTQEYFHADADFHATIFRQAGNRYISEMYSQLDALTHRMRQAVHQGPADVHEAVDEHAAILEAFESGDPERIAAAMHHHIDSVRQRALGDLSASEPS